MSTPVAFHALVQSLPTRQVVVGIDSNGHEIVAEVHSLFGGAR